MNLICKIFKHKYQVVQRFNSHTAKLKCTRCNCEFGINTNMEALLPWDDELEELHNSVKIGNKMSNKFKHLTVKMSDVQELFEILCDVPFDATYIADTTPNTSRPAVIESLIDQLAPYYDSGDFT